MNAACSKQVFAAADMEGITRQAAALGLLVGIPNGPLPLQDGPLG